MKRQNSNVAAGGGNVLANIQKLEQDRVERRRKLQEMKQEK